MYCRLPSMLSRFLITLLPLRHALPATHRALYAVVVWSLTALLEGCWPATDHTGAPWPSSSWRAAKSGLPLASGKRAATVQILGDWKWLKESLELAGHYMKTSCCHICDARKSGAPPFDDFGPFAKWRSTRRSLADYFAQFQPSSVPPLATLPGFSLGMIQCDPMHMIHLGFAQDVVGNLLVYLCEKGHWGRFRGERKERLNAALRKAFADFTRFCKLRVVSTSQPQFTASMVNRGDKASTFPTFSGKANNTRWVAMWLAS
eukprot:4371681-Alexandrium_andersonii.AAC.1